MDEPLPIEQVVSEKEDFPPPGALVGPADMSHITLVMAGHAHIDLGYRWDLEETVHRIAPMTFRGVLDLMDRTPGFTFCQSQMFLYQAMEREYPELFQRIRRWIEKGNWEVIGGAWCEYDAILPSGEAIIRQHLQGGRYALDHLGVADNAVAFVPDSFIGHAATLPQILSGCGIRYYLFTRGLPRWPGEIWRAFRWKGPDKSALIAYRPFGSYANPPLTPAYLETLKPFADTCRTRLELALYGEGDHGGGPRDRDLAALAALGNNPAAPRWRYGTAREFFAQAFPEGGDGRLPEYEGNRDAFATGALTSQAQIKRWNRRLEYKLVAAEAIAAIGALLQRKPAYPRLDFIGLWQRFLTLQFHDILPGTAVAPVYCQALAWYEEIDQETEEIVRGNLVRLQARLDTRGEGYPLLVYNPCPWTNAGLVQARYPPWLSGLMRAASLSLRNPAGETMPAQFSAEGVTFRAAIPALGYRLFRVEEEQGDPGVPERPRSTAVFAGGILTDGDFAIAFDQDTGDLSSVVDQQTGRELLAGRSNRLALWEEEEKSTSWVQAFTGETIPLCLVDPPRVVEADAFHTVVSTTSRTRWSSFTRQVAVSGRRIDFHLAVDWHERDVFLKLEFAPRIFSPRLTAAIAHGQVRVDRPEREFCVHAWVDVSGDEWGMSLVSDGVYGADYRQGALGLSVLRTARDMDPGMGHGLHELSYALCLHEGPLRPSALLAQAHPFLHPLRWAWDSSHRGGLMSWGRIDTSRALPAEGSFLSVDAPNVLVCAFKMPEEYYTPDALVVRLRELDGRATSCAVDLPVPCTCLHRADHLERPQHPLAGEQGRRVRVSLKPFEIATFIAYL